MWTSNQRKRLEQEKIILQIELPQFTLFFDDRTASAYGYHQPKGYSEGIRLKCRIPKYYPDEMPTLLVDTPKTLYLHDYSDTINNLGASHGFHTHENDAEGTIIICHTLRADWRATKTLMNVLFRGILWTEAYAKHMKSGNTIDKILMEWKRRSST